MTAWPWLLGAVALGGALAAFPGASGCIQIGPDAGDDASAGASSTVEEQCTQVVGAFCTRANDCYGEDPDYCLSSGVDDCCADSCDASATSKQDAVDDCVSDLGGATCDDILAVKLPSRCKNVVTHD